MVVDDVSALPGAPLVIADTALAWFWADNPEQGAACGNYAEHYGLPSVTLGSTYATKISYNGGFKWAIYRDGSFLANTGACHEPSTDRLQTGIEVTDDSSTKNGTSTTLQKRGSDNVTWSYNWGNSTLVKTGSAFIRWINTDADAAFCSTNITC